MRSLHFSRFILMLVLSVLVLSTMTGATSAISGVSEEPCMGKCLLNFLAFFILPWVIAGVVIFFEYRRRKGISDKL